MQLVHAFRIENSKISAIYINPDTAGKGIGTKVLNELEMTARNSKIFRITVYSTLNAKSVYMNHGYMAQELAFHSLLNGSKLECVRMIKDLSTDAEQRH